MSGADEIRRFGTALGEWHSGSAPEGGEIDCLEPGTIWSAVTGGLEPRAFREAAEHAVPCPVCGPRWRLAVHLARERQEPLATGGGDDPVPHRAGRRWLMLAAVSATIAAAAFFADWRAHRQPPVSTVERGLEAGELRSLLGPSPSAAREACVLRWKAPPESRSFRVEVSTVDARILDVAPVVTGSEYRVPPEKLAAVASGETIRWCVEATLDDGTVLRSPIFDLELR